MMESQALKILVPPHQQVAGKFMNIQNKYHKGFTLVEMLTVIIIMVILIGAAIPGWRNFIQNNQAAAVASKLYAALSLARVNAIQSGERVALCPVIAPSGIVCQNITNWDAWILFMDKNKNSSIDSGETLMSYYDQPAGIITANSSGLIYFDASGFASVNRIFTISPPGCVGNNAKKVTVRRNGNIQIDTASCTP